MSPAYVTCFTCSPREDELDQLLKQLVLKERANPAAAPVDRCRLTRWMFYPYLARLSSLIEPDPASGGGGGGGLVPSSWDGDIPEDQAKAAAEEGRLQWEPAWGYALEHAVSMAAELAWAPGTLASSLQDLLLEAVPGSFVTAAGEAAAALEEEAEDPKYNMEVEQQLSALGHLVEYARVCEEYNSWKQAVQSGDMGDEEAVQRGEQLVLQLLGLARQDGLKWCSTREMWERMEGAGGVLQEGAWEELLAAGRLKLLLTTAGGQEQEGEGAHLARDAPYHEMNVSAT